MKELKQERKCCAISSKGQKCKSWALHGKERCFFHQPNKEITRQAQVKGGKKGKRKPQALVSVKCIEDIQVVLQATINNVKNYSGSELAKARVIGYLVSILLRYFEILREVNGNEEIIMRTESTKKKRWIEETLKSFPTDIRDRLIAALDEKRQQLVVWFAGELRKSEQEVKERRPSEGNDLRS